MKRRAGFTITELLVSMALIMLIMAVMAEAFTESLKTFSAMKSIGDMDQKMRAAIVILTRDLSDDHFGQPYSRLSALPCNPITNPATIATAPNQGFFVVSQTGGSTNEGNDADGNPCPRNSTGTGLLHFTVNRAKSWNNGVNIKYGRRENYLMAPVPAVPINMPAMSRFADGWNYYSQVAEVAYFLRPTGETTTPTATNPGGLPRFTLFRRQAVILTDLDAKAMGGTPGDATTYGDVSWSPTTKAFNTFADVVDIKNRRLLPGSNYAAANPIPIYAEDNATFTGNDILLTDVLSFEIQVMHWNAPDQFQDAVYCDTSIDSGTWNPPSKGLKAIQITIRVWDLKTQAARQITIVQDL